MAAELKNNEYATLKFDGKEIELPVVTGTEGDKALDKRAPLVIAMKDWIDQEYEDGRQNVMTDKELEEMLERLAPGSFRTR